MEDDTVTSELFELDRADMTTLDPDSSGSEDEDDGNDSDGEGTHGAPDPAPPKTSVMILYEKDGLHYEAVVKSSWRTKTTRQWRHSVQWIDENTRR